MLCVGAIKPVYVLAANQLHIITAISKQIHNELLIIFVFVILNTGYHANVYTNC